MNHGPNPVRTTDSSGSEYLRKLHGKESLHIASFKQSESPWIFRHINAKN